ncbi:MAG TPA: hypothetical protein VK581_09130 [Chthoniobacterales bacterium]|nr:hypothetical protein [Chthoniobacterales bacterium]
MRARTIGLVLVAFGVAACGTLVPQIPAEEQAGYNAARRLIGAIEKFREDHGHYPAALHDLVPRYFRHVRQIAFSTLDGDSGNFEYKSSGDEYTLGFSYFARGMVEWRTYFSDEKKWHSLTIDP